MLKKEFLSAMRFKVAWAVMLMFALTALSAVAFAVKGAPLAPNVSAALFWVIVFFAAIAGIDGIFSDEEAAGTLLALKVYGDAQPVLFGKMLYALAMLFALDIFVAPMFLAFMGAAVNDFLLFLAVNVLGLWGMACAGTLVGALTVGAGLRGGLLPVLLLPAILPVFLPAVSLTAAAFGAGDASLSYLGAVALYDAALTVGASVLFDYLWYED